MPAIRTDVTGAWSVRLSVCLSVCRTCGKAAERNETPFDTHNRVVSNEKGPGSHVRARFGVGTTIIICIVTYGQTDTGTRGDAAY